MVHSQCSFSFVHRHVFDVLNKGGVVPCCDASIGMSVRFCKYRLTGFSAVVIFKRIGGLGAVSRVATSRSLLRSKYVFSSWHQCVGDPRSHSSITVPSSWTKNGRMGLEETVTKTQSKRDVLIIWLAEKRRTLQSSWVG